MASWLDRFRLTTGYFNRFRYLAVTAKSRLPSFVLPGHLTRTAATGQRSPLHPAPICHMLTTYMLRVCNIRCVVGRDAGGGFELIFAIVGVGLAASGPTESAPTDRVAPPAPGSRFQSHTLKLTPFVVPPASPLGLLLKVRIDNGPVLRLLLDSGAQSIVLDKATAAKSGHSGGSEFDLVRDGRSPRPSRMVQAGTVAVGDLVFHNCRLIIADGKLLDGIDGVIPLSLFAGFLVRLDIPGRTLELRPYPPGGSVEDADLAHVRASNDLLFIKAILNDSREGYVLLDTGASFNVISESTARALKYPRLFGVRPSRCGVATGATEGTAFPMEVRFRFGSRVVAANPVVVVGLSTNSSNTTRWKWRGSSVTRRFANRFLPSITGTVWSVSTERTCQGVPEIRHAGTQRLLPCCRALPRVW